MIGPTVPTVNHSSFLVQIRPGEGRCVSVTWKVQGKDFALFHLTKEQAAALAKDLSEAVKGGRG